MINSAIINGLRAVPVVIEATLLPAGGGLDIVGLPNEVAVRETRVRIRAALCSLGRIHPADVRLTVRLLDGQPLPAAFRGAGLDLPLAMAVCGATPPPNTFFFGELALTGQVRSTQGAFLVAELAQMRGGAAVLAEGPPARFMPSFLPVQNLVEALDTAEGRGGLLTRDEGGEPSPKHRGDGFDLSDIVGQPQAIRAVTVAAVAGLGVTLVGPLGSGRTMLARRLTGILPELTMADRRAIRRVASVAGLPLAGERPFRAPHHTVSEAALAGGGSPWRPGEMTLARHGVLLLDELTEFRKSCLERVQSFASTDEGVGVPWIVAAMDPCPGTSTECRRPGKCTCTPMQLERHRDRVKNFREACAPVLVRMTQVNVRAEDSAPTPSTATVRAAVAEARKRMPQAWPQAWKTSTLNRLTLAIAALEGADEPTSEHQDEAETYLTPL